MYRVGDKVRVVLPEHETTLPPTSGVRKFDRVETTVVGVHSGYPTPTYTLEGCVGRENKPYYFFREWLAPIDKRLMPIDSEVGNDTEG